MESSDPETHKGCGYEVFRIPPLAEKAGLYI
jgi:hypothetical protein